MSRLVLALISAVFSTYVYAQSGSKDWHLVQETDPVLQIPVCRAYTNVSSSLPVQVELSLSFPSRFDHAPMMILKLPANSKIERAVVPLTSKEQEDFLVFEAASDPMQKDLLWYVPIQMEKMVDIIIGNSYLPLKFTQNGKEVAGRISLSGSTATMNQVARCLKVDEILPTRFFRELNTAAGTAPLGEDQSVTQLMKYVDAAYVAFHQIQLNDAELLKLRNSMKSLLAQEADAQKALLTAQQNLDRAMAASQSTVQKIRHGEERLTQIPGEIQALQGQKASAEQTLSLKKSAYDPLKVQVDRLNQDVVQARNRADAINTEVRRRENIIRNGNARIVELEDEAARLTRRISEINSALSPLQRQKADLEVQLSAYDVNYEKQKILNQDWRYQNLRRDREQLEREERQTQQELQRARRRLENAEERLRQCMRNPNPQCTNEQQEVNQARSEVSSKESEFNNIRWRLENNRNDMNRIESEAEQTAYQGREAIATKLREVSRQVADYQSEKDRCQDRVQSIRTNEIPALESSISRAQTELPGLRRDLAAAQAETQAAESRLQQYKQSVDFDRIEREYLAAKTAFDNIVVGIARLQTEQSQINRDLPVWRSTLASQEREVQRLTGIRDQATAKLEGIRAQLQPMREKEQTLVNAQTTLRVQYDEARKLYQTLANKLLGP